MSRAQVRLLLLELLLGMLSHVQLAQARDYYPFTTLYCRCERKSDLHAIHQIESFFGSLHIIRDMNGFYIDNGITVIPPDQYPCSHNHHHHQQQRRELLKELESYSPEYNDLKDVDTNVNDVVHDQHGILLQEQYFHHFKGGKGESKWSTSSVMGSSSSKKKMMTTDKSFHYNDKKKTTTMFKDYYDYFGKTTSGGKSKKMKNSE
jgi:hypothetical protein